ncbi:MerR family transcriptional regulator [Rhizobium rosettiformans]|uniref:MerR family transcriptional regulator n=1 Tax=Rhizobium rosettiformans TaxID=1368430 RepID=UPI00183FE1DA|nr:MerR family transcriptional regulator [Rhizobium rosettiformans]MBA4797529.1 MerR family transcriptional regulator [Hyphomicrobiales bacterium]MDR7027220.1 DNA-binding transcriptional MerR regulator [Rhizobium rosettiformans]MDR7065341.1 DNA-binding transcriptional MerR regulator [Rhizobium rosettiformans]
MAGQTTKDTWLTAAQCAKRAGLTVRALRIYEAAGLLAPRRTEKNWRLYGAHDLARLTEILTLKRLGLTLEQISRLLAGQATDLERVLSVQSSALREQMARVQQSLGLIDHMQTKMATGEILSTDDLLALAKDQSMTETTSETIAWRRYEQMRPRTERAIDSRLYADYAGHYRLDTVVFTIRHEGHRLFARVTGQVELELFAEEVDRFFYKAVPAQISFIRNAAGMVTALTLHQNGHEETAERVDIGAAATLEATLAARIRDKRPVENSRVLLQELVHQHQQGEPDYAKMTPPLAAIAREQAEIIRGELQRLGALKDMTFKGVTDDGWDVYDVDFEKGRQEWSFSLAADGRFDGILFRRTV